MSACVFGSDSIPHGSSVTAYERSSVVSPSGCVSQSRTCNNGVLSGTYVNKVCSVIQPTPTPAPTPVSRGVVPAFTMPTILDGQVSGGQLFDSGSDQQLLLNVYADQWNPASIVHSKIYTRGSSGISFSLPARLRDGNLHTLYFATSTRDNSFNVVLGSQSFTWAVAPVLPSFRNPQAPLSSPNGNRTCAFAGQTLASGSSVKAYSQNVDRGSRTCMSQVRTCLNGVLSGSYTYSSCRTR